jgi:hypothetical protein
LLLCGELQLGGKENSTDLPQVGHAYVESLPSDRPLILWSGRLIPCGVVLEASARF